MRARSGSERASKTSRTTIQFSTLVHVKARASRRHEGLFGVEIIENKGILPVLLGAVDAYLDVCAKSRKRWFHSRDCLIPISRLRRSMSEVDLPRHSCNELSTPVQLAWTSDLLAY
jgi:hypothetical protein